MPDVLKRELVKTKICHINYEEIEPHIWKK